ncbi:hypothetical protein DUNSADRAFT_7139 [Dunaliella salina]|uniref:Uncharacterized protein n=1 Tax=Dunaliella salina TaxID=3046 RepID=A0ABQ7GM02_DUNSA|nr:hypothetical protein DUNSADRAFT_7139 [Dunaliella salina]|eukprot:KAF5835637.1 hypothetical protein DUNSADRAFT_7139 [Dunaliella salina]
MNLELRRRSALSASSSTSTSSSCAANILSQTRRRRHQRADIQQGVARPQLRENADVRCSYRHPWWKARDIFGIDEEDADEEQQAPPPQETKQEPIIMEAVTPYSIFIEIFLDQIGKDPTHPAYQPQDATPKQLARGLWAVLNDEQKGLFNQVFHPLSITLNNEMVATGAEVDNLLERVYQFGCALPEGVKDPVNGVLLAAMRQREDMLYGPEPAYEEPPRVAELSRSSSGQLHEDAPRANSRGGVAWRKLLSASKWEEEEEEHAGLQRPAQPSRPWSALRGMRSENDPDVQLVTRFRAPQPEEEQQHFWQGFVHKCRAAWDVFFPAKQVLSPAGAMRSRLKMILYSDRSGLDLPTLLRIKNQSIAAIAENGSGWEGLSELELQSGWQKSSGERVQLSMPLAHMPERYMLRDSDDYDYEYYDDDDYFDDDDGKVSPILEFPREHTEETAEARAKRQSAFLF